MKKTTAAISLAGSQLGDVRHVCAFFNNDDEEYRVLLPFIKDGFAVWRQGRSRRESGSTSRPSATVGGGRRRSNSRRAEWAIRGSDQHRSLHSRRPF